MLNYYLPFISLYINFLEFITVTVNVTANVNDMVMGIMIITIRQDYLNFD